MARQRIRGFTLIELLIVVAIISILAAIAVPNFLEAQVRAKAARMRNDLRSMAVAVENYHVDNGVYPPRTKAPASRSLSGSGDVHKRAEELARFTTPVAYLDSLPLDMFVPADRRNHPNESLPDFWPAEINDRMLECVPDSGGATNMRTWALVSVGPDKAMGFGYFWGNIDPLVQESFAFDSYKFEYDASNGTISAGNIYRFQGEMSTFRVFMVDPALNPYCPN